jgi:hypothetical protein
MSYLALSAMVVPVHFGLQLTALILLTGSLPIVTSRLLLIGMSSQGSNGNEANVVDDDEPASLRVGTLVGAQQQRQDQGDRRTMIARNDFVLPDLLPIMEADVCGMSSSNHESDEDIEAERANRAAHLELLPPPLVPPLDHSPAPLQSQASIPTTYSTFGQESLTNTVIAPRSNTIVSTSSTATRTVAPRSVSGEWEISCKDAIMNASCRPHFPVWNIETYYWQRTAILRFRFSDATCRWDQRLHKLPARLLRMYHTKQQVYVHASRQNLYLYASGPNSWEVPLPSDSFRLGHYWRQRHAFAVYLLACDTPGVPPLTGSKKSLCLSSLIFVEGKGESFPRLMIFTVILTLVSIAICISM